MFKFNAVLGVTNSGKVQVAIEIVGKEIERSKEEELNKFLRGNWDQGNHRKDSSQI